MSEQAARAAEAGRAGSWRAARRLQIALWIAVAEGVLVAVEGGFSKWIVILIAIPVVLFYAVAGRTLRWDAGRQLAWIAGASQVFAALLAVVFVLVKLFI